MVLQMRSEVRVGSVNSYSDEEHKERDWHTRSVVMVGAIISYSVTYVLKLPALPSAHVVSARHCRLEEDVDWRLSYSEFRHTVRFTHVVSVVGVTGIRLYCVVESQTARLWH